METVTKEILKDAANRLMFDMPDEQYDTLLKEYETLLVQMEAIGKIKGLEKYEPMTFPFDVTVDALREDIPETPLAREDVLKNAGSVQDNEIKLPKVVG